jgi:type I restriction enzyme, S subunit
VTKTGGRSATLRHIMGENALAVGRPSSAPPPGWKWVTLTDVARLESGHTPSRKREEYWGGDVPWLSIRDAKAHHGGAIHDTIERTNELGIANSSARILPAGTVCLSRTASVGYVVVIGRPMATSQDFVNWVCSDQLDPRFLQFLLISEEPSLSRFSSGAVHQTIYFPEVKAFHVCLPPLAEQRRIVALLDEALTAIDVARANTEKNVSNARTLFERASSTLLSGAGCSEHTLGEVCTISSKLVDPRKEEFMDLPHVGAGNIEAGTGSLTDVRTAREEGLISGKFLFDPSMVLYSKIRPYLMKACRPDFAGLCSADVYPLMPTAGKLDRSFLFHVLLSGPFTAYAEAGSARAGMPKVNRDHLFAYRLKLPPIELQREIAARVDAIAVSCKETSDEYCLRLAELSDLKLSLLQRAFSGQLAEREPLAA